MAITLFSKNNYWFLLAKIISGKKAFILLVGLQRYTDASVIYNIFSKETIIDI